MFPLTATIVSPSFQWAGQPTYINSVSELQLYAVSARARYEEWRLVDIIT
jgi:hypothetical protein